ncbi:multifunctional CCA tRNA nucleotidyl transferase/2'3'-cyclic phosphodiesterase/2'nucleotidase/phosphatase [Usitatibacter palustris]|uniref:Multifunctional CCA protein n=1 Tax=Usitatibacter palustris TaxID=2732487 RepID=A0A6M4HCJ9_9PROT|nr:multifunctional CCA tRNA nucleotidyl transferase/2'3'-cyclic phosphodiesterase/2'nucleotidase/phosphatase [Usitatibacter palustris]QJR16244.1 Multifunctional CCA protein [Usitatibacter palustris]
MSGPARSWKSYVVGGAVRDELLGLEVRDRDHVVVGATPEAMLAAGFRPVGADFPVFLHPESHEEYALARTERKTAPGYKGFVFHASPDVTLEEDLGRRDLTINAMARGEDGVLVDPHGGERDLRAGVLRHVGEAFVEDPVRILRVARFAARFGFTIAPDTMALMQRMVEAGEADALVPERAWQELSRGLMEVKPSRVVAVLAECGALARVFPEVRNSPALAARLDLAAKLGYSLPVRYALFVLDGEATRVAALSERINAPRDCRDLARLVLGECASLAHPGRWTPEYLLGLLERCDAFRRPERLDLLLQVAQCAASEEDARSFAPRPRLEGALAAARSVDAAAIARDHPEDIAGALRRARIAALAGR